MKCVEIISIFASHALRIPQIWQVLMLSLAQYSSVMFVFGVISCIAFLDIQFVEETRKMMYFERVTRPRIKQLRSP